MRTLQSRFVTMCQQLLALGVVLAVLTPASGVISLDIVGGQRAETPSLNAGSATLASATVPTSVVEPTVTEVPLTSRAGGAAGGADPLAGRTAADAPAALDRVKSRPQAVSGYAAVGVTWQGAAELAEDQISLQVRTRSGDSWSEWQDMEYHDEHGPDAGSAEAANTRPGTEPMFVGEVDDVQVKAATEGVALPNDLSVALVNPGEAETTETEAPTLRGPSVGAEDSTAQGDGDIELSARTAAPPTIFSRAQWGANEKLRDQSEPSYGTINAGFVHHTVNANDYTEDQVPGIIRSIYAYHVKSRGWRDVGYNFLVDRFGRIWEGRYGGVDKPVIGAHTLNYNEYSFAMSAIGNFDTVQPPDVMLRAYGQLFAWKLSLHGVNPASTSQQVGRSTFAAINGHRDAGATACPGKYLYAQLPLIRKYASQGTPTGPTPVEITQPSLQTNLVGSPHPDLVVRRASDGRGLILPTGGLSSFGKRSVVGKRKWDRKADVVATPDVTGDGQVDIVTTNKSGIASVRPGRGAGRFAKAVRTVKTTRSHDLLASVGDVNGDGRNDLVARRKGRLVLFAGTKKYGFARTVLDKGYGSARQLIGPGDINGDGHPDLLIRLKKRLRVQLGLGNGTFTPVQPVAGSWKAYNRVVGGGDYNGDGIADLLARKGNGGLYVVPGRGDGSFGTAVGPAANMKKVRFLNAVGNLSGGPGGDLIGVRNESLVRILNRDTTEFGAPIDTGASFADLDLVMNAGDVDRDGFGDVLGRTTAGTLRLYTGNGQGGLTAGATIGDGWGAVSDLRSVGDVTGDGLGDLTGVLNGRMTVWPGAGGTFPTSAPVAGKPQSRPGLPADLSRFDWVIGVADMQLKGGNDYITREPATGRLYYFNGRSSGSSEPRLIADGMGSFDLGG